MRGSCDVRSSVSVVGCRGEAPRRFGPLTVCGLRFAVCGLRFAAGSVVLLLVAFSASAAPRKKSVEARYKAPMQSEKYEVSVKAPQVIDADRFTAVITVTMLGAAKLTSATIKTEVSAPSAVKAQLCSSRLSFGECSRSEFLHRA